MKYKVKSGQTVSGIFKKYLLNLGCDLEHFLEINALDNKSSILADKEYKLPIRIYTYNGTSIRSTIKNNDWDNAVAVQTYNESMVAAKLKTSSYKADKVLWVPHHNGDCFSSDSESNSSSTTVKIFGKDHEKVAIKDHKLKGCVFYLVAGHGGPDPGAIGKSGNHRLCEDEYAYDITLRLARQLISHDALVYMITRDPNDGIRSDKFLKCDVDEQCWKDQKIPLNQKKRLNQRATAVNKLYKENKSKGYKYQRMIVIHVDSRQIKKRMDMFFYYYPGSKASKAFAANLQRTIKKKYQKFQRGRGYTGTVKSRDLFMLRKSLLTSAYVELGNIQNTLDQKRFIIESNREAVARWLCDALLDKK